MNKLYHESVYMKDENKERAMRFEGSLRKVRLSKHFQRHLEMQDKKHELTKQGVKRSIITIIKTPKAPFEVEYDEQSYFKFVVRVEYDEIHDISIVFLKQKQDKFPLIKTAWLNRKDDKHHTLNRDRYERE